MKKIIIGISLVILILCLLGREIYYFIVINNIYEAIENFRNKSNRYYSVVITNEVTREILKKDDVVKCNEKRDGVNVYCEWKDFSSGEEYFIDLKNKNFKKDMLLTVDANFLKNLPTFIMDIYKDNKFHITEFLKIKSIRPIEYNNQQCYKIKSQRKELIVDKTTYLPVYYAVKVVNSADNSSSLMENIYEFRVGGVTDEDVALPDLTGFTNMDEE